MVPNFLNWAPWIGKSSRIGDNVFNTEFLKCAPHYDTEITEAMPEELLFHLLQDEKVSYLFTLFKQTSIWSKFKIILHYVPVNAFC